MEVGWVDYIFPAISITEHVRTSSNACYGKPQYIESMLLVCLNYKLAVEGIIYR